MNNINCDILLMIFKLVNPKFTFKSFIKASSKAKQPDFKFFYFYGLENADMNSKTILQFQHTFRKLYPNIHCNIQPSKKGLTVWVSDNLKYDEMLINQ